MCDNCAFSSDVKEVDVTRMFHKPLFIITSNYSFMAQDIPVLFLCWVSLS